MSDVETLLTGGTVITVDEDRRVLEPGAVAVDNGQIVEVGDRDELVSRYSSERQIDLPDAVLLPGLVDSHGHAGHAMTKNLAVAEGKWLDVVGDVYFQASDTEFWRAESHLAALEHLESGVTTSISFTGSYSRVDDPKYAVAAAEGYGELGLRHVVTLGPPNPPFPMECYDVEADEPTAVDLDGAFETTATVIDRLDGTRDGRLSVYVGLSQLVPEVEVDGETMATGFTTDGEIIGSPESGDVRATEHSWNQMETAVALAEEKETNIHAHAYAGQVDIAVDSVPEILSPRLSLAHCCGMRDTELETMAYRGVSASHGPLTHAYARKRFPLVEAMEAGVNVAISTDGAAPDRSFDLLSQGRIAAQLQRVHFENTSLLPAARVLEMMTIDAARALGMDDEVGSLEAGKRADIIAVDLNSARLQPSYRLPERVVHYASGSDVSFVMVDGSVLLEDRDFGDIDVSGILEDAQTAAKETFERAGVAEYAALPSNE